MSQYKKGFRQSVDLIENPLCKELIKRGWDVEKNHDDVLIGKNVKTLWIELKNSSPFKKNGHIRKNCIRDSQFKILWLWRGQFNICWKVEQIENIGTYDDNIDLIGITPSMFRANYLKWLSPEMLKDLREKKIIGF